jgi:hypothetical protein
MHLKTGLVPSVRLVIVTYIFFVRILSAVVEGDFDSCRTLALSDEAVIRSSTIGHSGSATYKEKHFKVYVEPSASRYRMYFVTCLELLCEYFQTILDHSTSKEVQFLDSD